MAQRPAPDPWVYEDPKTAILLLGNAHFHPRNAIVERKVSHELVGISVHSADHDLRLGRIFSVGDACADKLPVIILVQHVEVDAADARTGHVVHDEIVEQRPAHADDPAVGREADG